MKTYFRHAALAVSTLLAGTAVGHAQTLIEHEISSESLFTGEMIESVIRREPDGAVITRETFREPDGTIITRATFRATERAIELAGRVIARETIELSLAQRRTIFRNVVRPPAPTPVLRERLVTGPIAAEYGVGAELPGMVALYPFPGHVTVAVPAVGSYRYAVVDDRVLLVDLATRRVVDEIVE